MSILHIQNLSKSYDGKLDALSSCTFSLQKGSICAIVGRSGSGKSTLLRLIAGLECPENGSITIDSKVVTDDSKNVSPKNRETGLVFQNFALFPHLTVKQNIQYGITKNDETIVSNLLKLIKMEGYENRYPDELSSGQEQRIAIARTLATKPKIILLDEPFSNLDIITKSSLRKEIRAIVRELELSMLFVTHDIQDALDIADQFLFLVDGKILIDCKKEELAQSLKAKNLDIIVDEIIYQAKKAINFLSF